MKRLRTFQNIVLTLLLVLGCRAGPTVATGSREYRETLKRAERLSLRISAFKDKHGRFPKDLSEVSISRDEYPLIGTLEWFYGQDQSGFVLKVEDPGGYPSLMYVSEENKWKLDN